MDSEHDYYYNALLINAGFSPQSNHHPGTPIYYLSSALLSLSGTGPEAIQRFFDLSYFVAAVVTAGALVLFVRLLLKETPIGISLLVLASIVMWPSYLAYANYVGSDAFIVAVGLPTVTLFWSSLEHGMRPGTLKLLSCGLGIGLCLATKMSFVPLAIALVIAGSVHVVLAARKRVEGLSRARQAWLAESLKGLLILPMGVLASYVVFTAPIMHRLLGVWMGTFRRAETRPPEGEGFGASLQMFSVIFEANIALMTLVVLSVGACVFLLVEYALRRWKSSPVSQEGTLTDKDQFDFVSGAVFLLLMSLAFFYTMASSVEVTVGAEAGIRLRNVSPSALVLPFLILYGYRLYRSRVPSSNDTKMRALSLVASGMAVLVMVTGLSSYAGRRQEFIEDHKARIATTMERFEQLSQPYRRVAFWTESNDDYLGQMSFHFWGNYKYAFGYFNKALTQSYPEYTYFLLREATQAEQNDLSTEEAPSTGESRFGGLGQFIWNTFGRSEDLKRGDEILAGQDYQVCISTIAYPEAEEGSELVSMTRSDLLSVIRTQFGEPEVKKELIGGIDWILIGLPGCSEGQTN
jgi:hypothetical protein